MSLIRLTTRIVTTIVTTAVTTTVTTVVTSHPTQATRGHDRSHDYTVAERSREVDLLREGHQLGKRLAHRLDRVQVVTVMKELENC